MSVEHGLLPGTEIHRLPTEWYIQQGRLEHIFYTGTHGDELYTREPVRETLEDNRRYLGGFFYIPELVPQAGVQNTRENGQGLDANRHAYAGSPVVEVAALMRFIPEILQPKRQPLKTAISGHGENEFGAYLYLDGEIPHQNSIDQFREDMRRLGIPLHNGVDDSSDPTLSNQVIDGMIINAGGEGSIEAWLLRYAKLVICAELPRDLPGRLQTAFFQCIINRFVYNI